MADKDDAKDDAIFEELPTLVPYRVLARSAVLAIESPCVHGLWFPVSVEQEALKKAPFSIFFAFQNIQGAPELVFQK